MARKNRTPEEKARREKIRELLQMANIGSMDDIQNLFKETISSFTQGFVSRNSVDLRSRMLSLRKCVSRWIISCREHHRWSM